MSVNGAPAPTTAPSFESFSFSFSRPSLLSRLNMNIQAVEPSSSTGTSAVTGTTSFSAAEPTSGASFDSDTRSSSITQPDQDMSEQDTTASRNDLDRDSSTPRAGSPIAMEIDTNRDPEIMEISSQAAGSSRIPAFYRDLPRNHHFVAPPAFLPYPCSPIRRFPEGHPLHTQPSLFGHLPRAPPRSPRLDPLEILQLESARERNEWEQVCKDLGRPRLERRTTTGPSQPHFVTPSIPQTQGQVNGNAKKAISQAPPSEDDYESDSSDVELRIYNADSIDEVQTPSQPNSALATEPPTPLGARPPVTQSLTANGAGSAAHRAIIERLSQGPGTPGVFGSTSEATAGTSPLSNNTTPAKRKVDDLDHVAQEPSAKRKSPAPHRPNSERTGVPPPLRAQVDRTPAPVTSSSVPPAPATTEATLSSQATIPQPIATSSSSTTSAPPASGSICRFHNRPPGRVCVRKDQCPDLHIGELQKSTPGASPAPPAIESPSLPSSAPTTTVVPPVIAPPLSHTPSLASAPPLSTDPSPPRRARPRCRYFSRPTGCARGVDCQFAHGSNEPTSRPPSRQLAPSPIPATQAPTATPAPIPVHVGPKAPLPATAASSASRAGGPSIPAPATVARLIPAPTPTVPFTVATPFVPTPAPLILAPTPTLQPTGAVHPLPAKPPPAVTSPKTSPKAGTLQVKGKKGKGKAAQATQGALAGPSSANKPVVPSNANANKPGGSANVQVKIEQDAPAPNTKAATRKPSGSQPKPQPARLNTGTREIKQEEVTLYDLADDSPQEPSGSSVLPSELTQSQPRTEEPHPRTDQTRPEVVQTQPRPIAPLPARAVPSPAPTASTVLTPRNRPPPPPYRPPPSSNANPSPSAQAPPSPILMPTAPLAPAAPPAPTVPATAVIPPTPVKSAPEQSAPKVPASASNGPIMNTANPPAANTPRPPSANGTTTQVANTLKPPAQAPPPTASTRKLSIPVPPRSNPSPVRPRPDMAPGSSPPQAQTQLRPRSREPARPDDRGLVRRMSPVRRNSRDPLRKNSRSPERRSLMTRIDHRSNPGGSSYRPLSRSRSPSRRHYSPPPLRRRSPPPPRGRSPSPTRYRDWRSRSRSPLRQPLRERFVPRAMPPRRPPSPMYSCSPSRSPMYRSPSSPSRSISRSPSRSPPRQRFEPRPPADGYTKGSAYFPAKKNIPRAWESEAGGSRPAQNQGYDSSPIETMFNASEPTRNSTPPPRNTISAMNEYDSFNQSRTMDISPMSSPARGYVGSGLGNRISDYSPSAANDYPPPMTNSYAPPPLEQRENLLTRMTGEPDLANRLAPASSANRGQAPNRAQPTNKPAKPQQPLANRLGGGDPYPSQPSRNDRRPPPPRDSGVRGGKLMSRMTGQ
ncbi:hypothetical protein ACGC1H_003138 [Rhizoctonia solani]